jgi:hypothetical protein
MSTGRLACSHPDGLDGPALVPKANDRAERVSRASRVVTVPGRPRRVRLRTCARRGGLGGLDRERIVPCSAAGLVSSNLG